MRSFITIMGAGLLVLSAVTVSNAKKPIPSQRGADYYRPNTDSRDRDGSCFSRSTGLPEEYACSSSGG